MTKSLHHNRRRLATLGCGGLTALAVCAPGAVLAQTAYPSKPVRIVVGQAPGGATDLVARTLTGRLTEALGHSVIVDNRTGAAGSIGAGMVAKSAPDGYTLLLVSSSFAINPSLYSKLPFDPLKDLAPVILLAEAPFLLVVHPSLPVRSVADLVKLARAKPDALNYASGGTGSSGHLAGELFKGAAGVNMVHVPHKGAGPALTDTIAGQVDLTFASMISSLQHVRSSRLRALAVSSLTRFNSLPNVPTLDEVQPGYTSTVDWFGFLGPAALPQPIVTRLNAEINKALNSPDIKGKFEAQSVQIIGGTPEEFAATMKSEYAVYAKVAKSAGINPE